MSDTVSVIGTTKWESLPGDKVFLEQLSVKERAPSNAYILLGHSVSARTREQGARGACYAWDVSSNRFWSTFLSGDAIGQPRLIFTTYPVPLELLKQWRLLADPNGAVIWPRIDNAAILSLVSSGIPMVPVNDAGTIGWRFECMRNGTFYDALAVNDKLLIVYLLVDERMTVWHYCDSVGSVAQSPDHVRIEGRLLYQGSSWLQVATFDVPFEQAFRVFHQDKKVLFWCEDGRVFEAAGLDKPRTEGIEPGVVEPNRTSHGGWPLYPDLLERFKGVNEKRVSVKQVDDLSGVTMAIRDDDRGNIYWVMKEKMVDNSSPRKEAKLDKPGLVPADASGPIVEIYKLMPAIRKLRRD